MMEAESLFKIAAFCVAGIYLVWIGTFSMKWWVGIFVFAIFGNLIRLGSG